MSKQVTKKNRGEINMKKKYKFWRDVVKRVREECTIEANSLDEATEKHNDGYCDYVEVDALDEHEILDEGTEEIDE
jgi:hypothetical protein